MKAIVVYEPGGPEQLVYTDVPRPTLKDGWSLVRVRGFGVNHSEIFTRQGLSPSVTFPRILAIECVGTVEETTDAENLPVVNRSIRWRANCRGMCSQPFRRHTIQHSVL